MRDPDFEASLHDARLYPQLWRLVLGTGLALVLWMGSSALIVGAAAGIVGATQGPMAVMPWLAGLATPAQPGQVILLLSTFGGLFVGAMVAAAALHFRGPGSLFGPWDQWLRGFLTALAVIFPIYGLLVALSFLGGAPEPNLEFGRWALLLPVGLVLLFIQTGAEELFFRGYLQQQLAVRFTSRAIWMWGPALIFALLHFNPDAGPNLPLVLLAALTFGLVAADLTERTGSLGAAMGLHFGNNFFGLFIVAVADTITGLALFVSPVELGEAGIQSLSMAGSVLIMLLVWAITARLVSR